MLVTKSTWVDVKQGTEIEIIEGIRESDIPLHARLVDITTNAYDIESDGMRMYTTYDTKLKFEWMDEE